MKGITFNQVREVLTALTNEIPATNEVCSKYTLNVCPGYHQDAQKGRPAADYPDIFVMTATVGKIKIDLRVEGVAFISESDEQLENGEYV